MRYKIVLLMALAGCLNAGITYAQSGPGNRKDPQITKEETIVIKHGHGAKTVIEVKDGNIYVNGDMVTTVQDATAGRVHKKIVIEGGREAGDMPAMPFFEGGDNNPVPRRAMLGVLTEPKKDGRGADIKEVTPNSAAAKAGLQAGDRITKVDDAAIDDARALVAAIGRHESGDKVVITFERDGQTKTVQATLSPANPESMARIFRFGPGDGQEDGEMPNAMMRRFPFPAGDEPFEPRPKLGIRAEDRADGAGIRVLQVNPGSPASAAGLHEGDVIRKIGDEPVSSVDELQMSLRDVKPNEKVKLEYERNGKTGTTVLTLPKQIRQRDF